jgi:predicted ester cyclase
MDSPTPAVSANHASTRSAATALLTTFYSVLNSQQSDVNVLATVVAPGWRNNTSNGGFAEYDAFLGAVLGLRSAVPDLVWTIDEMLVIDDRVVVRGHGTGTPNAPLFGIMPTGRSFSVLSIDVHTIRDGVIESTWHLEDWAGAMQQLNAPSGVTQR